MHGLTYLYVGFVLLTHCDNLEHTSPLAVLIECQQTDGNQT